jgi:hypothetical protein
MMPIHKIQVSEYECVHCGYKWINRVNGQDRPMPKNCAKCKRFHWNGKGEGSGYNPITPRERSMRVRLYKFEGYLDRGLGAGRQYRPNALCEKFLGLKPRPTMEELYEAMYPLGWDPHKRRNYIPDPDPQRPQKQGVINLKYESPWTADYKRKPDTEYEKLLKEETQKRKEFMKKVIKSRGEEVPKVKTEKQWNEEMDQKRNRFFERLQEIESRPKEK